jgi:type IV pilus assembly protein PilV
MHIYLKPCTTRFKQNGFSMLEVLITLLIIAVAMLGTAGLQLNALRLNKSSQTRTQAIFLASDIAERMEANKAQAILGSYAIAATSSVIAPSTFCDTAACNPLSLANWDLYQWGTAISALPTATWSITSTGTNPITYTIAINWVERVDNKTSTTSGQSNIQDGYISTRTIGN